MPITGSVSRRYAPVESSAEGSSHNAYRYGPVTLPSHELSFTTAIFEAMVAPIVTSLHDSPLLAPMEGNSCKTLAVRHSKDVGLTRVSAHCILSKNDTDLILMSTYTVSEVEISKFRVFTALARWAWKAHLSHHKYHIINIFDTCVYDGSLI